MQGSQITTYLNASYHDKAADYFSGARLDFLKWLPDDADANILEIGSGDGTTGALALDMGKCGYYAGVEMYEPAAARSQPRISAVHIGNIDTVKLPYPPSTFDALIMSEVVEHLVDPTGTLKRLLPLIRPGGLIMASSPNISHWRVLLNLYRGRFDYKQEGVMDYTHLRWFTPDTYREMFEALGIETQRLEPVVRLRGWKRAVLSCLGLGRSHLGWGQINYVGRKEGAPPP